MSASPLTTTLESEYILLSPLSIEHSEGLANATNDGKLWTSRVTYIPAPNVTRDYIETALSMQKKGLRLPFTVIERKSNRIIGTTSYHDILPEVKRLEIGYTWYAQSYQRTYVNTLCKFLLLRHAFETLEMTTVGLRTDHLNTTSQRAIERLGAKKDGVIRGLQKRHDGTLRDTVFYSITRDEWDVVSKHLKKCLGAFAP